jgi:nucleotide-binding universal stress UspA family protein
MKKILLLTDFSENSLNAIEYALQFFKKWQCKFFILHVQKTSEYITDDLMAAKPGKIVYQAVLENAQNELTELILQIQQEHKNSKYEFQPLLDYDNLTDAIEQAVNANDIDLIVMGTNGATGAQEVIFGSNTLHVIRNINNCILVVPEKYIFQGINSVLFSIHHDQEIKTEALDILKDVLIKHNANLNALLVLEEKNKEKEKSFNSLLSSKFKQIPTKSNIVIGLDFPEAISAYVQLSKIDLHALVIEKEKILDRVFYGSITKAISEDTQMPLLVLPHEK